MHYVHANEWQWSGNVSGGEVMWLNGMWSNEVLCLRVPTYLIGAADVCMCWTGEYITHSSFTAATFKLIFYRLGIQNSSAFSEVTFNLEASIIRKGETFAPTHFSRDRMHGKNAAEQLIRLNHLHCTFFPIEISVSSDIFILIEVSIWSTFTQFGLF